ncbi:hypothetical protein MPTK1_8g16370 [Marchantia polymorpha subsp. ruderalis]|uniref:Uncharacterized protein n=1 Tax=Marchantia polymorpha TaxID=3197 RepID=A0A2R6W4N2_MARPO|nr:hypothetical protein MARPO_0154s0027 [Marchantia polymorpha]BBN20092.1 hypothetical protein Mp_8g16370 [Marchantia polymorpha subsp. ruderalis]|eukprot:PTQ28801.1 hypothetical protein MARPO_0154s0027 [Marchantia polymorpha]
MVELSCKTTKYSKFYMTKSSATSYCIVGSSNCSPLWRQGTPRVGARSFHGCGRRSRLTGLLILVSFVWKFEGRRTSESEMEVCI